MALVISCPRARTLRIRIDIMMASRCPTTCIENVTAITWVRFLRTDRRDVERLPATGYIPPEPAPNNSLVTTDTPAHEPLGQAIAVIAVLAAPMPSKAEDTHVAAYQPLASYINPTKAAPTLLEKSVTRESICDLWCEKSNVPVAKRVYEASKKHRRASRSLRL